MVWESTRRGFLAEFSGTVAGVSLLKATSDTARDHTGSSGSTTATSTQTPDVTPSSTAGATASATDGPTTPTEATGALPTVFALLGIGGTAALRRVTVDDCDDTGE